MAKYFACISPKKEPSVTSLQSVSPMICFLSVLYVFKIAISVSLQAFCIVEQVVACVSIKIGIHAIIKAHFREVIF